ncbi:MAG TPA: dihydroxyacetone kinase phosphoryl donor subunit DhaM [Ktedonobacterales bacterium]|jgi:dihydroxyacetone kinase phosphotransfer subunit|nr:dihydroxyacetone kinase phosphoryl donor subunit DhaM [Ktedonobacterales bacterium]
MAVGLVIVSHSQRLAEGVAELAGQMTQGAVKIVAAGGTDSSELGTSLEKVQRALEAADSGDGVLLLIDLGSATMVAQMALEALPEERRARVLLSDAPLVEGAVVAAVEASIGSDLAQVAATAKDAVTMDKGVGG